ncbi:hypothetical protein, partial [Planomonospora algeriensis]
MFDDSAAVSAADALPAGETEPAGICLLEGCGNPLPAPRRDEHGRRIGGRPAKYCSPAHKDAAARSRREQQAATVAEPLAAATPLAA